MNFKIEDFISPRNVDAKDELQVPVDNYLYSPEKNKSHVQFKKETDKLFEQRNLDCKILLNEIKSS